MSEQLLELAARAMGYTVHEGRHHSITIPALWISPKNSPCKFSWSPSHNSGDAAEMCASLGIDTVWRSGGVLCSRDDLDIDATEYFVTHGNDRAAAWRMAALRVAAEIGRRCDRRLLDKTVRPMGLGRNINA